MAPEATVGTVKLDDERFDQLVTALTKISHGTGDTGGPAGLELLAAAIGGTGPVTDERSLAERTVVGLGEVARAIDGLVDAYRERTRRLG